MIFGEIMLDKVQFGTKTETRRLRCPYTAGRTYAVQAGRGKPGLFRILITSIHTERLGAIDDEAAKREGFLDRDQFFGYWSELHGEVRVGERVHVIRFERVG